MDLVNYDEEKFNALKEEVSDLIKTVAYKPKEINFIPLSAFEGDNIAKKSKTPPGTRDPPWSRPLMNSLHQKNQPTYP